MVNLLKSAVWLHQKEGKHSDGPFLRYKCKAQWWTNDDMGCFVVLALWKFSPKPQQLIVTFSFLPKTLKRKSFVFFSKETAELEKFWVRRKNVENKFVTKQVPFVMQE